MKTLNPLNPVAVLLSLDGLAFLATPSSGLAYGITLIAFFLSLKAFLTNGTWPQRVGLLLAAICLSLAGQLSPWGGQMMGLALTVMPLAAASRFLLFEEINYTRFLFLEPSLMALGLVLYVLAGLAGDGWRSWVYPLPVLAQCLYLVLRELYTGNKMLARSLRGRGVDPGQLAPDFSLPDADGRPVTLSGFRGKSAVLLVFVRGDWCPGCHIMLRTYERRREDFQAKDVTVLAVGPDPLGVNRAMVKKLGLRYQVLSDEGQRTAMTYGVQVDDPLLARMRYEPGIPLPAAFLVDQGGVVRYTSRPDRVGEFLDPNTIFPVLEGLA